MKTSGFLVGAGLLIGLTVCAQSAAERSPYDVDAVRQQLAPLQFDGPAAHAEATVKYFNYYGLDLQGCKHRFGSFTAGRYTIATHVFKPDPSKGTVIVMHGYYDHAGCWTRGIEYLVAQGYTVAIYDQPGHGLSSGRPAAIDDFSEYASVFDRFLQICTARLQPPLHVVAHSLGGAVTVDYLLREPAPHVDRVLLLAPLVHSAAWKLSGFGQAITFGKIASVPRVFRNNTSDDAFLAFMKEDPLQSRRVPMNWVAALRRWNKAIAAAEPCARPITILQGTADTTVDWKYNLPFLQTKFPRADITMIQGGGHHLINETAEIRAQVQALIRNELEGKADFTPPAETR